jgi:hypothetical protein
MKNKQHILSLLLVLTLCLSSCVDWTAWRKQGVVAECEGEMLTERDIDDLTRGMIAEDSARLVEQYIRQWCVDLQIEKQVKGEN